MSEFYLSPEDFERAEANGISADLLKQRFYRRFWEKERAITQPLPKPAIDPELVERAEANGVSYTQLYWRIKQGKWDPEDAVTLSPEEAYTRRVKAQTHISPHLRKEAEANGIPYQTLYTRIKRYGWTPEEAATKPPLTHSERMNRRWNRKGPRNGTE